MIRPALLFTLLFASPASLVFADAAIVTLDTGRRIRGEIVADESATDVLMLRQERPGAILVWQGRWNRIRTVHVDGVELTVAGLRDRIRQAKNPGAIDRTSEPESTPVTPPVLRSPPPERVSPQELPRSDMPMPGAGPLLPPAPGPAFAHPMGPYYDDGLCGRGVVVGLRDDPLSAYPDVEATHFPHGVPLSERGFARDLFRTTKAINVYGPPDFVGPVPLPAIGGQPASWPVGPLERIDFFSLPPIDGRTAGPTSAVVPSVIHDSSHHGWMRSTLPDRLASPLTP